MENKRGLVVTIQQVIGRIKTMLVDSSGNEKGVTGNPVITQPVGGGGGTLVADVNVHSGGGGTTGITATGTALDVHYTNTTEATATKQDSQTALLEAANSLVLTKYDNIIIAYTGTNPTTVTYKLGAVVVSTLTCTYDVNDNITSVTKT